MGGGSGTIRGHCPTPSSLFSAGASARRRIVRIRAMIVRMWQVLKPGERAVCGKRVRCGTVLPEMSASLPVAEPYVDPRPSSSSEMP
ncbi:hypothetical protein SL003B_2668 [Polymorphum gilvum SL003B-26A1]|uniref:Uncharacterized protein n=1 Tax=Polymorphum gilvum (strain LMG 25793 / CGMCC 1.9160 / SL003B-26A1) TaxID=991905 RepID=F2J4F0_POLGS|nr:hypothetical protein SL003B_2668 [Polymorphum gilvum SL003B-26A1]